MRSILLSLFLVTTTACLSLVVHAQTYFYVGSIAVVPAEPTTSDVITIALTGDLSSSGASIVSTNYMLMDNIVHITVNATDAGGLGVLVPHTEEVEIGNLPEGAYGILVDGDFILDSAPENEHSFNVVGGQDCSTLTVGSIQWATFNDTSIVVNVTNTTSGFDYPGFILLNEAGDTIAIESVNLFAIAGESWHTLTVQPDVVVPNGAFNAELQLWTDFYGEQACTWNLEEELCPEEVCVTIFPYLINTGGAIALGDFDWTITDANGSEVASGTFTLTMKLPNVQEEVCLPVGEYQFSVTPLQEPTGGQLTMGIGGLEWSADVSQPFPQGIPTGPLPFSLVPACFDGTNGLDEAPRRALPFIVSTGTTGIELIATEGRQLGAVTLMDPLGRMVYTQKVNGDRVQIPVATMGAYVVQVDQHRVKLFAGSR